MGKTRLRQPKVGLAGVMCTPFRGDKESYYASHREALAVLTKTLDFELMMIDEGLYTLQDVETAAGQLQEWGADFVLLQTSSFAAGEFIYPFAEQPFRLGLWAIPEGPPSDEGGLPLNSFTATNMYNSILKTSNRHQLNPVKWFYGNPGQDLFNERLRITVQAMRALINLEGAKIALIGGVAPGFDNLIIDYALLEERLGIEVLEIDIEQILEVAKSMENGAVMDTSQRFLEQSGSIDEGQSDALERSSRILLALQTLNEKHDLDAVAVSCWPQFQEEYRLAICSVLGMANQEGLVTSCEGDIASAASMLALRFMSGGDIITLMDLATIDESDQSVLMWHCGPTAPALSDEHGVNVQPLWLFDGYEGDPIGLHNDLVLNPGPVTIMGFTVDFNHALMISGSIDNSKPSYSGSRGWLKDLHLNGAPISVRDLVQTLMDSGFQHHYPLIYGNWIQPSLELAHWLGIDPIQKVNYRASL